MKRYRFYCGLVDREHNAVDYMVYVKVMTQRFIRGFTLYHGTGYWEGNAEPSLTIEVLVESGHIDPDRVALFLRDAGNQDAILWTAESVNAHLVTR